MIGRGVLAVAYPGRKLTVASRGGTQMQPHCLGGHEFKLHAMTGLSRIASSAGESARVTPIYCSQCGHVYGDGVRT